MGETHYFTPEESDRWPSMQATKIDFTTSSEEFIDNSFSSNASRIAVILEELADGSFMLTVADNGCGIPQDRFPKAMAIDRTPDVKHQGMFNQYGRGLKSATASFDTENAIWEMHTTQDGVKCYRIKAPYSMKKMADVSERYEDMGMPKDWKPGSGTLIRVPVSRAMFESINLKVKSDDDERLIRSLLETLRVVYGPVLQAQPSTRLTLTYIPKSGVSRTQVVEPLLPTWKKDKLIRKTEVCDFGRGEVELRYTVGSIEPHVDNLAFFRGNQKTSGLMIYYKGRLIKQNIFSEIWNSEHNKYNTFLFTVDMWPLHNNWAAVPLFRPDKDDVVYGDPCFKAFAQWVRKISPSPGYFLPPKVSREVQKCWDFSQRLEDSGVADMTMTEMALGAKGKRKAPLRADVYARLKDGRSIMYEAKIGSSKVNDLGQLATNCLMAHCDGLVLDELVLIAKSHSEDVVDYIEVLRKNWYRSVKIPKIRLLTWKEVDSGSY